MKIKTKKLLFFSFKVKYTKFDLSSLRSLLSNSKVKIFLILFFLTATAVSSNQNKISQDYCLKVWNDILIELYEIDPYLYDLYAPLQNRCGKSLREGLKKLISVNFNSSYAEARRFLYTKLHVVDDKVCSVYVNTCFKKNKLPNGSLLNCEHTWPQSHGASDGIARADLHHLFPTTPLVNSIRSDHFFCEVSEITWEKNGSKLGRNEKGATCFEPRDKQKTPVALAMFYFAVRFNMTIDKEEEFYLRNWIYNFPVSNFDRIRNDMVESFQGNRNPFIDQPKFMLLIDNF